jgi:hypothetical protein
MSERKDHHKPLSPKAIPSFTERGEINIKGFPAT